MKLRICAKFRENKPLTIWQNHSSFIDIGKSCLSRKFHITNMSFNAIRKNKILAKISESTVASNCNTVKPVLSKRSRDNPKLLA